MNDPITNEIIRHGLLSAAEEMARDLCRTSYNTIVYEIHDYGIGIHDVHGDVVADAPGIAIFTRANDHGIKRAVEFLGLDAMRPGDVFLLNYPYWSSAHALDPLVFAPIHLDDRLVGFTSCRVHVLDLKQKDPGYVVDSTDLSEEGMLFPAVRLYDQGRSNDDIWNVIRFNSRLPEPTIGDLQAEVSACVTGVKRTQEIARKYGAEVLADAEAAIHDHGDRLARLALAKLPTGTWTAHDFVDSDGVDLDRMVKMAVTVTVEPDRMIIDWTGSDTHVRGPINVPRGLTEAVSSLVFKSLTTPDSPVVAGNFRALEVVTEPGSVMHAVPPQPTFTLWTAILAGEVITKALAKGTPDVVPASSGGDVSDVMALGINPRNGKHWLEATNEAVGFGAHDQGDGEDGIMHISEPGCRNNPIEVLETKAPLLIDSYAYRQDSGGAGNHRGGVGIERTYRFLAPSTAICLIYKTKTQPWAIGEGRPGLANQIALNPGTPREEFRGVSSNPMEPDDVLTVSTGGGGGYGHPFDRDPARVARDVRNGYVSSEAARTEYGVEVEPGSFTVDDTATAALRAGHGRTGADGR